MNKQGLPLTHEEKIAQIASFLNSVGIKCHETDRVTGFIDHIRIVKGEIYYTGSASISGLLHEAGHTAILLGNVRDMANDDIEAATVLAFKLCEDLHPDHPAARAAIQSGDTEATAWAWAAGIHLGFSPEEIIEDSDYDGDGAGIRLALQLNSYFGINGLHHAGMCKMPHRGGFPIMIKWVQDSYDLSEPGFQEFEGLKYGT